MKKIIAIAACAIPGFLCGYFLTIPVNCILMAIAVATGIGALYYYSDKEIAGIIGILIAYFAFLFVISVGITMFIVNGMSIDVNLSWLLR